MVLQKYKEKVERRKSKPSKVEKSECVVHVVRGSELEQTDIPAVYQRHRTVIKKDLNTLTIPDDGPYAVCTDCGAIASNYKSMLKVDKIHSKGRDDIDDVIQKVISDMKRVDESEYFVSEDIEVDVNVDDSDSDSDSGIDKSILDDDSGLDAYR